MLGNAIHTIKSIKQTEVTPIFAAYEAMGTS